MKQPEKHRKRLHTLIDQIKRSPQVTTNQEHLVSLFEATIKDGSGQAERLHGEVWAELGR